jgi:hypothetical protein
MLNSLISIKYSINMTNLLIIILLYVRNNDQNLIYIISPKSGSNRALKW